MARRNFPGSGDSLETVECAFMGTDFVEDAPAVGVREENMYLEWPDGRRIGMPFSIGRLTGIRINKAIAERDARRAEVVPFRPGRKRGHAAMP